MILKKAFLILVVTAIYCQVNGQTYSIVDDGTVYSVINDIIKTEKKDKHESFLSRKHIYTQIHNTCNCYFSNKVFKETVFGALRCDTVFNPQDYAFVNKQVESIKDTTWHTPFKRAKMLAHRQKKPNGYYFSVPLFSQDKQTAVVRIMYVCGSLCSYGGVYVYRRIGKQWKKTGVLESWIS